MPKKPTSKELETRLVEPSIKVEKIMDGEDQKRVLKKLFSVLFLAALFMGIEIAGGIISNSIAILSDAAHMLSDLLGFVISIVSVYISGLPANKQHSYGYHRAGVIGALVSVMVIWVLTAFLIYYAIQRVINLDEVEVEGPIMFGIACFGLLTNLIMIKVLHGDHGHGHSHGHGNSHGHSHGNDHSHESPDHSLKKKTKINDDHSHGHAHIHSHTRGVASMIHEHKHKHEKEHAHDLEHDHHEHIHSEKPLVVAEGGLNNASVISEGAVGLHVHDEHDHDHDHDNKKSLSQPADHENMNVRATIIHIFGDILQSIGVIIASSLIWINPKFKIADPIVTFIFAIIVLYTTIRIVKDCIFVLMEGTPADFDLDEFEMKIKDVQGVIDVHDLHVWALGVGKPAMSAHIYADDKPGTVLKKVTKICNSYGISHTTIQVETTKDEQDEDYLDCKHNIH